MKEEPGVSSRVHSGVNDRLVLTEGEALQLAGAAPRCCGCGRSVSKLCLLCPGLAVTWRCCSLPIWEGAAFRGQYWPA